MKHAAAQLHHTVRLIVKAAYHLLNDLSVLRTINPTVLLASLSALIVVWLWLAALVGRKSALRGQSFWYGFFLSFLTGPILGVLFAMSLRPAKSPRRGSTRKKISTSFDRERVA